MIPADMPQSAPEGHGGAARPHDDTVVVRYYQCGWCGKDLEEGQTHTHRFVTVAEE